MENVDEIVAKSFYYFGSGYNCSESILLAIAKDSFGLDTDLIPKIATGFGGGISRQGHVCGAVSGAVMGFGLKYGRTNPEELRAKTYNRVVQFFKQFQKEFGSILCKELSGCDLSTIEGIRKFREDDVHEKRCRYLVTGALKIFTNLINET